MGCDQTVPPSNPKQLASQKRVSHPDYQCRSELPSASYERAKIFEQFRDAIRSAGLEPLDDIEADGKLRRFASNGKRGDDAGWYILHGDGIPAGCFGDWRTGVKQSWRADIGRPLTPAEEAGTGRK